MVSLAADSSTKYCIFNLKSKKDSCPLKVVFISPVIFFGADEFLSNYLGPIHTFPFPGGVMGNIF